MYGMVPVINNTIVYLQVPSIVSLKTSYHK